TSLAKPRCPSQRRQRWPRCCRPPARCVRFLAPARCGFDAPVKRFLAYAPPMHSRTRAIDRRLEALVVASARRRMPVLRLVPVGWIRPVIKPTVVRLRVSVLRVALASAVTGGSILALLILARAL